MGDLYNKVEQKICKREILTHTTMLRTFLTRTSCLGRYTPSLYPSSLLSHHNQHAIRSQCQSHLQAGKRCSSNPATPSKLYSKTHQYLIIDENKSATVGMTPHGQHSLGDVVYLELPEPGTSVAQSGASIFTINFLHIPNERQIALAHWKA